MPFQICVHNERVQIVLKRDIEWILAKEEKQAKEYIVHLGSFLFAVLVHTVIPDLGDLVDAE